MSPCLPAWLRPGLRIEGTGTGAASYAPQPGPRDERGAPSRSAVKEQGTVRLLAEFGAREEYAPETEVSQPGRVLAAPGWLVVATDMASTAGHGSAHTSREKVTVCPTVPQRVEPVSSAVIFSLVVVHAATRSVSR
jgi:hypothetical protein